MAIFLSALSGVLIAVMMLLNASLGAAIGVLESSFVVHLVGTLFAFVLILFFFRGSNVFQIKKTPKHLFAGGLLGVVVVLISNFVVPKLGMVLTAGLFLTGNMIFAVVADHFGLFNLPVFKVTKRRMVGLLCAAMGLFLAL